MLNNGIHKHMNPLIVYHPKYESHYVTASVECPERIAVVHAALRDSYEFVAPQPAEEEDVLLVHTQGLLEATKRDALTYEVALLAVGGALQAARLGLDGAPSFGLIRPPGHHASPDSHWGFCFFNNMAIAIERLRTDGLINRALILDIDLHFGDGTDHFFRGVNDVVVANIQDSDRQQFLQHVAETLENSKPYDIIGISAGFDRYRLDWGGTLDTEDYRTIGEMVAEYAIATCGGRRFALLEGGYYLPDLGKNVSHLLEGLGAS
jgi:acetoin utilization deacetylase AcuC-like enzyme